MDARERYPRHDRHRRQLSRCHDARPGRLIPGAARRTGAAAGLSYEERGRTLTTVKTGPQRFHLVVMFRIECMAHSWPLMYLDSYVTTLVH
jgi:hypothetical protein